MDDLVDVRWPDGAITASGPAGLALKVAQRVAGGGPAATVRALQVPGEEPEGGLPVSCWAAALPAGLPPMAMPADVWVVGAQPCPLSPCPAS